MLESSRHVLDIRTTGRFLLDREARPSGSTLEESGEETGLEVGEECEEERRDERSNDEKTGRQEQEEKERRR
ncbi:hypothetical protein E1301_Tti018419 [Triplophysa tibetana]|uniref:Uncharacterized protein n=1 Tax=Triplophysa tibetana TaxID=1572043 RepID=A0A5A9PCI0_9TELE|nr:hypothetical protein E1301_Tti018419 [Triplophysa tibetana]